MEVTGARGCDAQGGAPMSRSPQTRGTPFVHGVPATTVGGMSEESPITRHRRVVAAAEETDYVISRRMLRALDVTRHHAAQQVAAARWRQEGNQTFSVRDAPLTDAAARWRAVWEVGHRVALVDGVSALQASGLKGWKDEVVHVSLLHSHAYTPVSGVKVHKIIRRVDGEALDNGVPRTRPAVAAIRAAHWAVSDKAAATIVLMAVQQRLVTPRQLWDARKVVRGRTRRAFIRTLVRDLAFGVQSLGELDVATALRERGLKEPTRQQVREMPNGRIYLDAYYEEERLVLEIDGAQHFEGLHQTADFLRANDLVVEGDRVLRINVLGFRLEQERFLDQLEAALSSDWALENVARARASQAASAS